MNLKWELCALKKYYLIWIRRISSQDFCITRGGLRKLVLDNKTLYAAIVALGTNLGFVDMANSTLDIISLEKLKHVAQWCIRPDVINEANDFLIKKHSEHPLAQLHGDFTWSGSDGDRFCIQKSTNLASFYPKAFGYYQKSLRFTRIYPINTASLAPKLFRVVSEKRPMC